MASSNKTPTVQMAEKTAAKIEEETAASIAATAENIIAGQAEATVNIKAVSSDIKSSSEHFVELNSMSNSTNW